MGHWLLVLWCSLRLFRALILIVMIDESNEEIKEKKRI